LLSWSPLTLFSSLQADKVYPRADEHFNPLNRGRLRVQLKDAKGAFVHNVIHTRTFSLHGNRCPPSEVDLNCYLGQQLFDALAKAIPQLPNRGASVASSSSSSSVAASVVGAGDAKAGAAVSDKPQKKRGKKDKH